MPSIVHQLVHSPKTAKADLSSVLWAGSGAAYLPPALSAKAKKLLGVEERLLEGYGLSEAVSLCTPIIFLKAAFMSCDRP